jgi:hypothetical protein
VWEGAGREPGPYPILQRNPDAAAATLCKLSSPNN